MGPAPWLPLPLRLALRSPRSISRSLPSSRLLSFFFLPSWPSRRHQEKRGSLACLALAPFIHLLTPSCPRGLWRDILWVLPGHSCSFLPKTAMPSPWAQLPETYCWCSLASECVLGKMKPPLSAHLLLLRYLWFGVKALERLRVTVTAFSGSAPYWWLSSKDLVTQPNSELLEGRALSQPFLSPLRQRWALTGG